MARAAKAVSKHIGGADKVSTFTLKFFLEVFYFLTLDIFHIGVQWITFSGTSFWNNSVASETLKLWLLNFSSIQTLFFLNS